MRATPIVGLAVVCAVAAGMISDLSRDPKTVTKTHTVTVTTPGPTVTRTRTVYRTQTTTKPLPSSCASVIADLESLYEDVLDSSAQGDNLSNLISSLNVDKTVDSNAAYVKLVEQVNSFANILGDDAIGILKNRPTLTEDLKQCKEDTE